MKEASLRPRRTEVPSANIAKISIGARLDPGPDRASRDVVRRTSFFGVSRPLRCRLSISGVLLSGLLLMACGSLPPHPPYAPQTTDDLIVVVVPPPPGRIERIPDKPRDADTWVTGEWILRHGRWYWLLGRWVRMPPGVRYAPWVVVRNEDGVAYYAPSAWKNAQGAPAKAPSPLAYAVANSEAVYDADGNMEDTGRTIEAASAIDAKLGTHELQESGD